MAKAIAVIQAVFAGPNGAIIVSYTVAIDDGKNFSADASVSLSQTIAQFYTAARAKVAADCASRGSTVLPTDVIICGGPA